MAERNISGKRVAILVADGFEQVELTGPEAGAGRRWRAHQHRVAGGRSRGGMEALRQGGYIPVDVPLAKASAADFDALLLPGGVANPDRLRTNPAAVKFVRDFFDAGKPVAAICHAPWTLIEAGVVRGRKVTSWPSLKTDLKNAGAQLGGPGSRRRQRPGHQPQAGRHPRLQPQDDRGDRRGRAREGWFVALSPPERLGASRRSEADARTTRRDQTRRRWRAAAGSPGRRRTALARICVVVCWSIGEIHGERQRVAAAAHDDAARLSGARIAGLVNRHVGRCSRPGRRDRARQGSRGCGSRRRRRQADTRGRRRTTGHRPGPGPTASGHRPRNPSCDRDTRCRPARSMRSPPTSNRAVERAGHHRNGVAGHPAAGAANGNRRQRASRRGPHCDVGRCATGAASAPAGRARCGRPRRRDARGSARRRGPAPMSSSCRSSTSADAA